MPCKIELSDGRVFDESEFYSWLLDGGYDDLIKNNIIAKRTGEPTKPKGEMRKSGFQERSIERGENERVKEIARNNEVYYESVNQKEEYERSKAEYGTYEDVIEKYNRLRLGDSDLNPQLVMDRQVALQTLSIEADRRDAEGLPIADITDKMIEVMNAVSRDAAKAGQMSALTAWRFMSENSIVMAVNRMVSKENEKKLSGLSNEEKAEVDALKEKISELEKLINEQKAETKKRNAKKKAELVNEIVADVDSETLGMITKGVRKDASEAVKKKVNNFFDKLLANENGPVMATVVPITPKMYNAFVNLVRKAVLSGIDLGTALNNASAELIRNKEVTPAEATELRKKLRETMASMKEKKAPTEAQIKRKESAEKLKEATKEFNAEKELTDLIAKERERQARIRKKEEQRVLDIADREEFRRSQNASKEAVKLEVQIRLEKQKLSSLRRQEQERQAKVREKEEQRVRDLNLKEELKRSQNALKELEKAAEKLVKETIQDVKTQLGKSKSAIGKDLTIEDFVDELIQEYESMDPMDKTTNQRLIDLVKSKLDVSDSTARTIATKIMKGIVKTKRALDIEAEAKVKEKIEKDFSKLYGTSPIPGARKREVKKDFDKIVEGIENGVLSDDFFRALFLDKFGLKPDMTPEQAAELRRLAKPVARLNPGSKLYNDAVINMAKYIEELYPRNFWSDLVDTWISLAYVNMLSGISTQALNIFSTSTGIVNSPFRNALNLNKWARAFSKGIKEGSLETFKAYSPIYESAYIPQAWAQGSKVGGQLFMETMANGAVTDKYVEELVNTTGKVRINQLERNVYGKGKKFKPIIIGGKDVNPLNFAKYVPRLLSAQDMFMYQTEYETQVVLLALALNREKGLRGKELDNAVNAAISSSYSDLRKAETQVRNEITLFELSGNKVSDRAKAIRISEVLAENMLKKLDASKEQISETKELARAATFTQGTRNGIISMLARLVNRGINKNRFTQLFGKPFVPFVNIVGEVMEFSLDSTPGYGLLRAYGATPSAFIDYMRPKFGLERKGYGANMGQVGSRATDEQLSRAWQGTIVFIAFASMFAGTEEDDPIYLTGGYLEDEKKRKLGNTNVAPKYSIVIKGKPFSYMNIPVINIPLALIGNYNDYLKNHKYDKEDIEKRQALAVLYASFNLLTMVKDMTFLEGVSNLIDGLQDAFKLEGNKLDQAMKTILAQYTAFFGRPLPQNNNLFLQIQKFFDPTSYSKKDVSDILAYSVGLQRFNNASLDIFGDPVKNYPSQSMVPYDHWFNLVNKSENWKFLSKFNAIQPKLENDPVKVFNKETDQMEVKKLNSDEFYALSKLVGSKFKKKVTRYRILTNTDERVREVVNGKNGVDYDIAKLRTEAKQEAVYELFIKTKLEQKVADSLDELRATEGKIKEKKEKIKARIEKLRLEKSGLTEQDLKVGAAIEDAGRNRIPVFLDIAQQKGYNTFESVKEYAKRFRKAGILSDEDMGEIIRVARAYEN